MKETHPLLVEITDQLKNQSLGVVGKNLEKPWGAYLLIDPQKTETFIKEYFPESASSYFDEDLELSPKILLVAPNKKLSWQYHHRRKEVWSVIRGPVGVVLNSTDELVPHNSYKKGDLITIGLGERHRLIGLENWGVIAEIWVHTDPNNPSNEEDIIRVQDDFNR